MSIDSSISVLTYSNTEFLLTELVDVASLAHVNDRITRFNSIFTPITDYGQIWLELPATSLTPRYISVITYDAAFDSNCFQEGALYPKEHSYHNVKVFEDEEHKQLLAHILWSKSGKYGELIHVQRGKEISGTEIKEIALRIFAALKIEQVILHDAAELAIASCSEKLRMASYLPIVSPEKKTWYEKDGFTPLACNHLQMHQEGVVAHQDPQMYALCVEKIRNFDLITLAQLYWKSAKLEKNKIALCDLALRYLPKENAPISFSNLPQVKRHLKGKTIAELGQNIFAAMRKHNARKNNASADFVLFYNHILPTFSLKKAPEKLQNYLQLGEELRAVRIWEKHFSLV